MGMHPRNEPQILEPANNEHQNQEVPQEASSPTAWTDYIPYYNFTAELCEKFDKPFVILLGVQNINHGLWTVAVLAC